MTDERIRERARKFYRTQPTVYRATEANEHAEAVLNVMVAFALSERDAATKEATEQWYKAAEDLYGTHVAISIRTRVAAQGEWKPIATAPKNAKEVRVKMRDGKIYERAHWASDLSGSEQPPFQGWFIPCGRDAFTGIDEPEFWMAAQGEK